MLKAILFDVDGTFAETEEFHRRAFHWAFGEHAVELNCSPREYRELLKVTGGKERIAAYFRAQGKALPEPQIQAIHRAKNARYGRNLVEGAARLRPGILRLLRDAWLAGLDVGIATTASEVNLDALLRPLLGQDWAGRFACVVAGDQVARKKPAPDVSVACLQRLAIAPSEAIAFEDSAAGVAAARGAGIAVIATPSLYSEGDDFSQADWVLPHLGVRICPGRGSRRDSRSAGSKSRTCSAWRRRARSNRIGHDDKKRSPMRWRNSSHSCAWQYCADTRG